MAEPPEITEDEEDWRSRQLGLFSLQVRYESQRRGGITRLTRGPIALAAGVGTLGEGLGNHLLQLHRSGDRASDQGALDRREPTVPPTCSSTVRSPRATPRPTRSPLARSVRGSGSATPRWTTSNTR